MASRTVKWFSAAKGLGSIEKGGGADFSAHPSNISPPRDSVN